MAKSYIDIVKYMVEAKFEILGSVEKPDIIGAVFGQTEGLLGSDLDLRELQKNGKIGRIEIETSGTGSRTYGKLLLPSSLGKVETCILAAAIESVDRVGPFETSFKVEKIEDTRNAKRMKVVNRAKELVKNLIDTVLPDSREISDMVEADVKSSTVVTYGPEKLPAGPDISKSDSVVIVEGRADVVNLLKNDVPNCISIGGATGTVPKTIIDLCGQKESTVFLDGDRGGDIILKGLTSAADIDYIARAPDGKEVEELTRKEIIKALRSRVPFEQGHNHNHGSPQPSPYQGRDNRHFRNDRGHDQRPYREQDQDQDQPAQPPEPRPEPKPEPRPEDASRILSPMEITKRMEGRTREESERPQQSRAQQTSQLGITHIGDSQERSREPIPQIDFGAKPAGAARQPNQTYVAALNELRNTLRGRLYAPDGSMTSELPIRELLQAVQDSKGTHAIVFDGIVTQRLMEIAYGSGVREIYAIRASQISKKYEDLVLYTAERGVI